MRSIIFGCALFVLGLIADFFVEHTVSKGPSWVSRLIAALFVPIGVGVILVSDVVWPHIYARGLVSDAVILFYVALVGLSVWWFMWHRRRTVAGPPADAHPEFAIVKVAAGASISDVRMQGNQINYYSQQVVYRRLLSQDEKNALQVSLVPFLDEWRRARLAQGQPEDGPQLFVNHEDGGDNADYARQFADFFRSIGFRVYENVGKGHIVGHDYHWGLWLRWRSGYFDEHQWPNVGKAMMAALESARIPVTPVDHPEVNAAHLIVGSRPL